MTLITFPARLQSARHRPAPGLAAHSRVAAVLALLRDACRRLADAPLDSPVLQVRPVPRTQTRVAARDAARAATLSAARTRVRARVAAGSSLRQYWLPLPGPDGRVRLEAHWSPRP